MQYSLPLHIDAANGHLIRKLTVLFCLSCLVAFLLILLDYTENVAGAMSAFFRLWIPSLSYAPHDAQHAFVNFFGLTAFLTPMAVAYLMTGDPVGSRFRHAISGRNGISLKRCLFLYMLALPTIGLILYFSLVSASLSHISERITSGARLVHRLTESPAMLLLVAPIMSVGLWLLTNIFLIPLIGPFIKPWENPNDHE